MQLSASILSVFIECPRCFFLDRNLKIARPRGIFSSLPGGIDGLLKADFDGGRGSLPIVIDHPETEGFVLFHDLERLNKYRNWKGSPLKYEDAEGNVLVGALDDLLYSPAKDMYAPLDFKTKGSEPDQAYCEKYYQKQLDIYGLLLASGDHPNAGFGVLLYFWPVAAENGGIKFASKSFVMEVSPERAQTLFASAIECLKGPIPAPGTGCDYCKYHEARGKVKK